MKVVITSATEKEILLIKQSVGKVYSNPETNLHVSFHESGVGVLSSCFSISKMAFLQKPNLIIQTGIAGGFNKEMNLGKVVIIKDEFIADSGAEENGKFHDLFDLNLLQENSFPYSHRRLRNPYLEKWNLLSLDTAIGVTVSEATTNPVRIGQLKVKYNAQSESMEGASLHYCCLQLGVPFLQVRAISNYVGERNKSNWRFKESFDNLASVIVGYIETLNEQLMENR